MRLMISLFAFCALVLGAAQAQAKSCSSFAVIKAYDAEKSEVTVKFTKGKMGKYFPKPEGAPKDTSKIPGKCGKKITKNDTFPVKAKGGRLSITQIRTNFEGKMLNDVEDAAWLPGKLDELITGKTQVVLVMRPGMGKGAPVGITTVYLPANEDDLKEIERLESLAEEL